MTDLIWLVLFFPLLGALICATHSAVLGRRATSVVACSAMFLAFFAALHRLFAYSQSQLSSESILWEWAHLPTGAGHARLSVQFGALVDPLCLVMLTTVTGVAALIHWYSAGYMSDEPDYGRYFACMNLFVATMVCLVMANNLVMLLVGWGGVGFASYSLIGFWQHKASAVAAARKAFLINVVGDIGLLLAICMVADKTGSVQYSVCFPLLMTPDPSGGAPTLFPMLVCFCLLVAAYAKSAQLPMHTWLPDAMEGPTPVSALIHAATMVTAGVYLVVRCHALFEFAPQELMQMVAILGATTAIVAASAAMVQTDLKRILAYSTMSQLGYMFLAAGMGAYSAAIFHLVTHAFFKALLFLTAGIVIHALHGEQDVRKMGGLFRQMPGTALVFLVGGVALAGLPPLSGFFSKEAILGATLTSTRSPGDHLVLLAIGVITAAMTAYYSARAYFLVFHGPERHDTVHQPGFAMEFPVLTLALLTAGAGYLQEGLVKLLDPLNTPLSGMPFPSSPEGGHLEVMATTVGLSLAGVGVGWALHGKGREAAWPDGLRQMLMGCWGFDAFINFGVALVHRLADWFYRRLDYFFSRWIPEGLGFLARQFGLLLGQLQTGSLRHYAVGLLAMVALFVSFMAVSVQQGWM